MTVTLSIEVRGGETLNGKLDRLARQLAGPLREVANRQVAIQIHGWVLRNFRDEGRLYDPRGWAPHAPSTVQSRARKIRGVEKRAYVRKLYRRGYNRAQVMAMSDKAFSKALLGRFPILQDTGALRESFDWQADQDTAVVGAKSYKDRRKGRRKPAPVDLARIHQEGTDVIPARPMLPTREQAGRMAIRVYERFVAQSLDDLTQ